MSNWLTPVPGAEHVERSAPTSRPDAPGSDRGADGALPETKQLIESLQTKVSLERTRAAAAPDSTDYKVANSKIGTLDLRTGKIDTLQLDDAYAALAMACTPTPVRGILEPTRAARRPTTKMLTTASRPPSPTLAPKPKKRRTRGTRLMSRPETNRRSSALKQTR